MSCENDNKAFNTAPAKGKRWFASCVRSCERARGNDSTLKNFLVLRVFCPAPPKLFTGPLLGILNTPKRNCVLQVSARCQWVVCSER